MTAELPLDLSLECSNESQLITSKSNGIEDINEESGDLVMAEETTDSPLDLTINKDDTSSIIHKKSNLLTIAESPQNYTGEQMNFYPDVYSYLRHLGTNNQESISSKGELTASMTPVMDILCQQAVNIRLLMNQCLNNLVTSKNGVSQQIPATPLQNALQSVQQQSVPSSPDPPQSQTSSASLEGIDWHTDYSTYLFRVQGLEECKVPHCQISTKEHFHCRSQECSYQRFTRRDEVVRHFNYHRKKVQSFENGFLRFSHLDNCKYDCPLSMKNTHYHCIQPGCNKVYTSTSDLLTHKNYHRKNATLVNDGFQRFSALDDCGVPTCQFYNERTTHFHCCRNDCKFTFKNKCDIDKHKNYHIKDADYQKQGMRKFLKNDACPVPKCPLSKQANHFHCLEKECSNYYTSMNQIMAHLRKHSRNQRRGITSSQNSNEKDLNLKTNDFLAGITPALSQFDNDDVSKESRKHSSDTHTDILTDHNLKKVKKEDTDGSSDDSMSQDQLGSSLNLTNTNEVQMSFPYKRYTANDFCVANCSLLYKDHFHCSENQCNEVFLREFITSHISIHKLFQKKIHHLMKACNSSNNCKIVSHHLHCSYKDCSSIVTEDKMDEHYCFHFSNINYFPSKRCAVDECSLENVQHFHCNYNQCNEGFTNLAMADNHLKMHTPLLECLNVCPGTFEYYATKDECRRPNCNYDDTSHLHCIRSSCQYSTDVSTDAVRHHAEHVCLPIGTDDWSISSDLYICVKGKPRCDFSTCKVSFKRHYHCSYKGCTYFTINVKQFPQHFNRHISSEKRCDDFYRHFPKKVDCLIPSCLYNRVAAHYHCTREGCNFCFQYYPQMKTHTKKHEKNLDASSFVSNVKNFKSEPELVISTSSSSELECVRDGCQLGKKLHFHCAEENCDDIFTSQHNLEHHFRQIHGNEKQNYEGTSTFSQLPKSEFYQGFAS